MNGNKSIRVFIVCVCALPASCQGRQGDRAIDPAIWVREGFRLSVAVVDIEKVRFMAFGPDGTLFVSVPDAGQIRACSDEDGDGQYEKIATFVKGHPTGQGLFWHDGWLWFSESGAIFKARDTNGDGVADEQQAVIPEGQLPRGGHWWRSILIHNGRLYTSIGDSGHIYRLTYTGKQAP